MPKRRATMLIAHVHKHPEDTSALRLLGRKYGVGLPNVRLRLGRRGIYFRRPR